MAHRKDDLKISQLNVDVGNFRLGDQETIRAAYKAMIEEQGAKLGNLADDILTLGMNPSELLIVVPTEEDPNQYTVVEGNRRLTALKLMDTPALAAGTALHQRFLDLSKRFKAKPIRKASCVILESKQAAFVWIERKHRGMDGRGVAEWNAPATSRADEFRGKVRPSKAILDHLKSDSALPAALEASLTRRTTNIDRVFQMPYLSEALGVTVAKEGTVTFGSGDAKKGNRLLIAMLKKLAEPNFTVEKIRHSHDREDFIDGFAKLAVKGSANANSGGSSASSSSTGGKTNAAAKAARKAVDPLARKSLASRAREFTLHITEPRLNQIYGEACRLTVEHAPNCAGILTRVFLELATEHFLNSKSVALTPHLISKQKTSWSDLGVPLAEKIKAALAVIDATGKAPELKAARTALSDPNALHSIDSLHEFVHRLTADPDHTEVKRIWQRWHPYFARLFA